MSERSRHPSASVLLEAMAAHRRGANEEALRLARRAARDPAARGTALGVASLALAGMGRDADALAAAQASLSVDEASKSVRAHAIAIARRLRELPLALTLVDGGLAVSAEPDALLGTRHAIVDELHLLGGAAEHTLVRARYQPTRVESVRGALRTEVAAGRWSRVPALLERASTVAPSDPELRTLRAELRHRAGASVREAFEPLVRGVTSAAERVRLSDRLLELGDLELARDCLGGPWTTTGEERAIRIRLARFAAWAGDLGEARACVAGLEDVGDAELRCVNAIVALAHGDCEGARRHAEHALRIAPDDDEARLLRADALRRLGRVDEALSEYRTARADRGASAIARALLGVALGGDEEVEARADVTRSLGPIEIPGLADAPWKAEHPARAGEDAWRRTAGQVLDAFAGNFTRATTVRVAGGARATARRIHLRDAARVASVRCFDRITYEPMADVMRAFDALVRDYADSPLPLTHRAELHLWVGEYAACERDCRAAIALAPDVSRWARVGLSQALVRLGRSEEAIEILDPLVAKVGPLPPALAARGEANLLLGRRDRGRADLQSTLRALPSRISAAMLLALADAEAGDDGPLRAVHARLLAGAPILIEDARHGLGRARASCDATSEDVRTTVSAALEMMRGNRSSGRVTWFPPDGRPRLVSTRVFDARAEPTQTSIVTGDSR